MKAGILRDRITIQRSISSQDEQTGEEYKAWEDAFVKVPAEIAYLSGRDFIAAQADQSEITAHITIRYIRNVNKAMRILFEDKVFNIQAILPDKETGRTYQTVLVSEGVNDG